MPQLAVVIHVGSISPSTTSHTNIISPTSTSHVGDRSTTSAIHVEYMQLADACHVGTTTLVIASHTTPSSPTSRSHVEYLLLASASHGGSMSPATSIHVGGIHMTVNPRRIGHKTKFLYKICKQGHLTCLCPTIVVVQEVSSLSDIPSGSESSSVPQLSNPSFFDTTVLPMQSSAHTTPILESDASLDHVVSHPVQPAVMPMQFSSDTTPILGSDVSLDLIVSHPIQPMVEEVVVPMQSLVDPTLLLESDKSKKVTLSMQYSVNPTLLLGGDAYFEHVLTISIHVTSEQGSIPLSLSTLPQIPRMVSFDWNDIVDNGSYASILSSSAWQVLGSPKIVSVTCELLTFDKILAWEP
jgi:hypothetical protein